jgi:phosphoribosylamine--glycine ligase
MGAYSPAPIMTPALSARVMDEIVLPTVRAMNARRTPFKGVLYAGLMIQDGAAKLIEYNVRFGDPEAQVLMMRLKSDLLALLLATARGTLDQATAEWSEETALSVVMAARGYPGSYQKGSIIRSLPSDRDDCRVFHAGTAMKDGELVATGGRVLNITATGRTVSEAQAKAYQAVSSVDWDNGFYRNDIGWRAVEREEAGR